MSEPSPVSLATCPSCGAELQVPKSPAPSRQVRCPRCKTAFAANGTPTITLELIKLGFAEKAFDAGVIESVGLGKFQSDFAAELRVAGRVNFSESAFSEELAEDEAADLRRRAVNGLCQRRAVEAMSLDDGGIGLGISDRNVHRPTRPL